MPYNRDFLTNVIFRIDFAFPEDSLKDKLDIEIRNKCIESFPIPEQRIAQTQNVTVSTISNVKNEIKTIDIFNEWHFYGSQRDKEFVISKDFILLQVNKYSTFNNFKTDFFNIYELFIKKYQSIKIKRIGLRYIDQISPQPEEAVPNNWYEFWSKYLSSDLLGGLSFSNKGNNSITRHMNSLETNSEDFSMRFKWGIFNTDYPATNKKKEFILDTDLYNNGLFNLEEIETYIDKFHIKAKEVFENSITDNLRELMGKQ